MSSERAATVNDRKVVLSTLWIFVMFNYIYADFVNMVMDPAGMTDMARKMGPGVMFGWAVVLESAIAMIVLSRFLTYRVNRWANIIIGIIQAAAVAWTLSDGLPPLYYLLFAVVEIACTLFVVWYAWTWRPQAAPAPAG